MRMLRGSRSPWVLAAAPCCWPAAWAARARAGCTPVDPHRSIEECVGGRQSHAPEPRPLPGFSGLPALRHAREFCPAALRRRRLDTPHGRHRAAAHAARRHGGRHRLAEVQGQPGSRRRSMRVPGWGPGKLESFRAGLYPHAHLSPSDALRLRRRRQHGLRRSGPSSEKHLRRRAHLEFLPGVELEKPLCKGAGLDFVKSGRGVDFLPIKALGQSLGGLAGRRRPLLPHRGSGRLHRQGARSGAGGTAQCGT